jgi:hypothetical protein
MVEQFMGVAPSEANYFRGVVLFGRNVASYKFALAKCIIELAGSGAEAVSLEQLAEPFSRHIVAHLNSSPRQGTARTSEFLDACRRFSTDVITAEELRSATVRLGFQNVIDAFHVVGSGEIPVLFFIDERRTSLKGIRLTDAAMRLAITSLQQTKAEIEARWQLVETAWALEISSSLIAYDATSQSLRPVERRRSLISARDALNGYQKGACFYCYCSILTIAGHASLPDVDHLFPHVLQRIGQLHNLDQVWNLVLACRTCNRGPAGKFDSTPDVSYVGRLHRRNEYLIVSHHPLRETLMAQTGITPAQRRVFLQQVYDIAATSQVSTWVTSPVADPRF